MHGNNIVPRVVEIEISAPYNDSHHLICTKSAEFFETGVGLMIEQR